MIDYTAPLHLVSGAFLFFIQTSTDDGMENDIIFLFFQMKILKK